MDDDYEEIEPKRRINPKTLVLLITVIAVIAVMAFYTAQSRDIDQSLNLHFTVSEYSLVNGRLRATITNDGVEELNIEKIQINQGSVSCFRLPKNVKPGDSVDFSCNTSGIEVRESYLIIVNGRSVASDETYKTSFTVIAIK